MTRTRFTATLLAFAAASALVFGTAACGSDDSSEGDAAQASATADEQAEKDIRATFAEMQEAYSARDAGAICGHLTTRARQQTARDGAPRFPTCEKVAQGLFDYGPNIRRNAKIVKLRVDGDKALATVTAGETVQMPTPFAKTETGWKMDRTLIPQPQ